MSWKTWAFAMGLGVALTAHSGTARAFDRGDGPTTGPLFTNTKASPLDIADLYAWAGGDQSDTTVGKRVFLVMTVGANADKDNDRFSSQALYIFHTIQRQAWKGDASPPQTVDVICKFDTDTTGQGVECWAGQNEYVKGKVKATLTSTGGKLKVFTGPRNDPFFMNNAGMSAAITNITNTYKAGTKNAASCHAFTGTLTPSFTLEQLAVRNALAMGTATTGDSYKGQNVLAIIVSVDPSVLLPNTGKPILEVWGAINKPLAGP